MVMAGVLIVTLVIRDDDGDSDDSDGDGDSDDGDCGDRGADDRVGNRDDDRDSDASDRDDLGYVVLLILPSSHCVFIMFLS
jgi:hypothetical protein